MTDRCRAEGLTELFLHCSWFNRNIVSSTRLYYESMGPHADRSQSWYANRIKASRWVAPTPALGSIMRVVALQEAIFLSFLSMQPAYPCPSLATTLARPGTATPFFSLCYSAREMVETFTDGTVKHCKDMAMNAAACVDSSSSCDLHYGAPSRAQGMGRCQVVT